MFSKQNLYSMAHTFIATFLTVFVAALAAIPADSFFSPATWTTAFILSLVGTAVRAAIKTVSTAIFPTQG